MHRTGRCRRLTDRTSGPSPALAFSGTHTGAFPLPGPALSRAAGKRAAAGVATSAGPGTIAGSDGGRTAVAAVFARKSGAAAARGEADAHGQTGRAGHQHPHQFRLAGDPRLGEDLLEVLAHRFVGDAQVLADFFQS